MERYLQLLSELQELGTQLQNEDFNQFTDSYQDKLKCLLSEMNDKVGYLEDELRDAFWDLDV